MTTTWSEVSTLTDGDIEATVWRAIGPTGTFHGVQFDRCWRDAEGNPRSTNCFKGAELLRLAQLATRAYDELADLWSPKEDAAAE